MSENRLGHETSPYLLQHKDNHVHWRPWGPEALSEARATGKPILLSVGYAACHWCHVMAHESFEDDHTAAVMNELFVNIKVDREERPDIDAIYMGALHRLGEHGGWPLTMFLDTGGRPFWGGTYFPKASRWGKPAFVDVLHTVSRIYREQPEKVAHNAGIITGMLGQSGQQSAAGPAITDNLLSELTARMVRAVDLQNGGITGAPKFPQWNFFWLLWRGGIRYGNGAARAAVEKTLTHICQGGIYDHLAGGFARYAVDERWLVPHFEKMLYDNALLLDLMTEVWRETHNPLFKARIAETAQWVLSEMVADGGGFAASLDADSEGEEGKFYVWSSEEIEDVLGSEDAHFFSSFYDVTSSGNWEGRTILSRLASLSLGTEADEQRLETLRGKLLARRAGRPRPGWDDKVLADWNGLMIAALARAGQVFDQPNWLAAAERAFAFVETSMMENNRLWHAHRGGRSKVTATASDYANMIWGALRLHQATSKKGYLGCALAWSDILDRHYWDATGGYATTADDTDDVIVRLKSAGDDATPSANAIMVANLSALALLTGEGQFADRAMAILEAFGGEAGQSLVNHSGLLASAMDLISPQQLIIAGRNLSGGSDLINTLYNLSLPGALEFVVAEAADGIAAPALAGKSSVGNRAAAYACIGTQCSPPIADANELAHVLRHNRGLLVTHGGEA